MGERRGIAIVVAVAIAAASAATLMIAPGCTTHKCDPVDQVNVPGGTAPEKKFPNAGFTHDPNIWESGTVEGPWVPYQHQQTLFVEFRNAAPRPVEQIDVYISNAEAPYDTNDIFAIATGNVAELQWVGSAGINIRNNTCQDYFARVVVTFAANAADASAPLDAAADAAQDAPADAGTE